MHRAKEPQDCRSGNPVEGPELQEKVTASLGDRGTITEFLFHPKKNLAIVTIETDEDLSFEEVSAPRGCEPFQVGPINLENVPSSFRNSERLCVADVGGRAYSR